jgi:hypothetical protein
MVSDMKTWFVFLLSLIMLILSSNLTAQLKKPIIIDHKSVDLNKILDNSYIDKAKEELFIGYGHTSHGSQLITGMNALMTYFKDGRFNWRKSGGSGFLRIEEGGTLSQDCGYPGWDDKTRTYLNNNPNCNVIIWSWCGQVNEVDLNSHYLSRMNNLELNYPNVKFVYMTGHLEGQGPDGSLEKANNTIRKFCIENNKILYDFADIEKYSPNGNINYDEYYADDGCNYRKPDGGKGNWANEWLAANPDHILSKISAITSGCAHSVSLNCVMKGIASWHLWAKLAGWDGSETDVISDENERKSIIYPNVVSNFLEISFPIEFKMTDESEIRIYNSLGKYVFLNEDLRNFGEVSNIYRIDISNLPNGVYFFQMRNITEKFIILR